MNINLASLLPNNRYGPSSSTNNQNNQNQVSSPFSTQSRQPKKEAMSSVPMVNNIGDENSFFNSIIHMLHFTSEVLPFLRDNKDNFKAENSGYEVLDELFNILDKYDKLVDRFQCYLIPEEDRFLDVKNLRQKISDLYKGEGFFKMNNLDEPVEILYFFLNSFHSYMINMNLPKYYIIESKKRKEFYSENIDFSNEKEDKCDPICISHSLFNINIIQQTECLNCNGSGNIKKFPNNFFIFDLNYKDISIDTKYINKFKYLFSTFFHHAKKQVQFSYDQCPNKCKEPNVVNKLYVMEVSKYLFFSINWKEIKPTLEEVCKCYFMIQRTVHNKEIFDILDKDKIGTYALYGLISYWNGHYISFFTNRNKEWFLYHDMITRKMPTWKEVMIYCIKNHYHPVMLFYKKLDSRFVTFEEKIVEKDFTDIMEYCKTADEELIQRSSLMSLEQNKEENLTASLNSSLIRPIMQPNITNDYDLLKTVENLQKLEEIKEKDKSKKYAEDSQKNESMTNMVPEGINLFAGKWICHKCHNHNNFSVYQCSKCQEINVKVYEIIYNSKTRRGAYRRNFKNNPSKFEKLTRNFELNYSNLIKAKLNMGQKEDAYKRIKKMQEEEAKKLELEKQKKLMANKVKFVINPDKTWTCIYCGFFNEDVNIDFCEQCKWNKPQENELIEIKGEVDTISSMKQYL